MTRDATARDEARSPVRLAGWLAIPDPLVVELSARAGFDWIGFDLQHGAWDFGTAFRNIQLADVVGTPVLVRLPDEQLAFVPRVLDHGAAGIVLAMVSDPAVAAAAVARARYQPEGLRSYGGQRYGMRPEPADLATLRPGIFPMIETRRGLDAVEEIAAVPGVAGLHIGPVDLALALTGTKDVAHPACAAAVARIVGAAHDRRLPVTIHAVPATEVPRLVAAGFDELVLTADIELLRRALAEMTTAARAALVGSR